VNLVWLVDFENNLKLAKIIEIGRVLIASFSES
jgi:hypothetical protein